MEALRDGDAVPAKGPGLLIGDVIAVDRGGPVRRSLAEPLEEGGPLVSRHFVEVVKNRVEESVRGWTSRNQYADSGDQYSKAVRSARS